MSTEKAQENNDLSLLLSSEQRDALTLLIGTITEIMRKRIEATFDTVSPPTSTPEGDNPNIPKADNVESETPKESQSQETERPEISSPKLLDLRRKTLSSFDSWRDSVLRRIEEVLNSPDNHATPKRYEDVTSGDEPVLENDGLASIYPPVPTPLTDSLPKSYLPMITEALLLLLLSLEHYDARSRTLLLYICSSLKIPLSVLISQESATASTLIHAAEMSADQESKKRAKASKFSRRWKVGLASVAGAAVIGITGGLAAPLVAAGISGVLSGIGLGATAAAGYLGAVAGSSAIVGALFGAYGGKMTGEMVGRYAAEVKDFAFIPVKDKEKRLRVTIGVTGWLTTPEEITSPWNALNANAEVYALRWEMDALLDLGSSLQTVIQSYALAYLKVEIIKRTVLATLWAALWPIALLKAARVIDNPFSIAKHRSEKAGKILADALINKAQGERPVTLIGFSLGARVIYFCLLELAKRGAFGLVENVVLMGAPTPTSGKDWKAIRAVVSGRVVNVFSDKDYVLAFLYRTSSIQLGIAGLQMVNVKGVENIDVGDVVEGHLRYPYLAGILLNRVLAEDIEGAEVGRELELLKLLDERERMYMEKGESSGTETEDIEKAVQKAEMELQERRRRRAIEKEEEREQRERERRYEDY
ncbi:hypothetical protein RUND412_002021 [Rhizina undulata]